MVIWGGFVVGWRITRINKLLFQVVAAALGWMGMHIRIIWSPQKDIFLVSNASTDSAGSNLVQGPEHNALFLYLGDLKLGDIDWCGRGVAYLHACPHGWIRMDSEYILL